MMAFGAKPGSQEEQIAKTWLTNRYHAPSDDLNQPVDLKAAGQYNRLMMTLAEAVANNPARPTWKADSFFRRLAQSWSRTPPCPAPLSYLPLTDPNPPRL